MEPSDVPGSSGISLLDTRLFDLPGVMSAYLVEGERTALVDTGAATAVEPVLTAMADVGVAPADLDYVVATHVHLDHAGAAGTLAHRCPNATVLVHERGREYLVDPDRLSSLVESARRALGETADEYGDPEVVPADRCRTVTGGDDVDLGDRRLRVIDAPGHAPHQVCLLDDRDDVLFAADAAGMALGGELYPTTPPPDFDLEASLETVERLAAAAPELVCYGHFGARTDADAALREYRELLPAWVDAVRAAADDRDDPAAVVDALDDRWAMPTVERDVAGVLRYLDEE